MDALREGDQGAEDLPVGVLPNDDRGSCGGRPLAEVNPYAPSAGAAGAGAPL